VIGLSSSIVFARTCFDPLALNEDAEVVRERAQQAHALFGQCRFLAALDDPPAEVPLRQAHRLGQMGARAGVADCDRLIDRTAEGFGEESPMCDRRGQQATDCSASICAYPVNTPCLFAGIS
jgi:hypothetical protein